MSEGDSHESDILFCPFCGDVDALEVQHLEGAILYPAYRVACDNCGAAFAIRSDIDEWNTRALPAVQPDAAPAGNLTARGNAATWALYDANLTHMGALQPDSLCECGMTGPCKWTECKAPILSAHVNETPKSEHDAANMLTPATKGGAHD